MLMIAASIGGFVGFIVPQYKAAQALKAQAADYNQILENARRLQEERNKLVTKYNAFDQGLIGKLNTMLPRNPENVKLILELDSIAKQYGMTLQNVKIEDTANDTPNSTRPGAAPVNPDIGTLRITFSLAGSYEGFTNFIRTIEKSLRIIDIQKVAFTALDDTKSTYQYTVGIKTYWLK
jgi:Tfp pilus assembly protein PilO